MTGCKHYNDRIESRVRKGMRGVKAFVYKVEGKSASEQTEHKVQLCVHYPHKGNVGKWLEAKYDFEQKKFIPKKSPKKAVEATT